jgi:hypothetical protein
VSESESLYDWRCIANQFVLATSPLRLTTGDFFLLNPCGHSPYVTFSLREDGSVVYNCCWSSPAQSYSGPSPAGLMTTFYCLRFETPPTWRTRSPYSYPPGTSPVIPPGTGFPLRATVEVFDPASTRDTCLYIVPVCFDSQDMASARTQQPASHNSSIVARRHCGRGHDVFFRCV